MKRTIKLWEIALLIGCLLTLLFGNLFQAEKTVSDLQQHVLRMHILANSDSDADQQLKYQVRDALLASSETLFGSSQPESREALETTAKAHLHEMETIAQQVVQEQGYSYPVKAELVTMPFTERTYEDLTMPAGTYEAIRITIGAAAGQNWWCVMYPTLCFVDSTYQIVPGESKEKLKKCLTEEEYNSLLDGENGIETSSLFIEWIRNILFS